MKNFFLNESEKTRIKFLYESKGILLSEETWVGLLARAARKLIGKNSDEIATALKTSEKALMTSMDDIISNAAKSKNIQAAEDIQVKLMHIFNPSGEAAGVAAAKENVKNFLNGYAKSKGKENWVVIKDEIRGGSVQPKPQAKPANDDFVQFRQAPPGARVYNEFSGRRISNNSFGPDQPWRKQIDPTKITNWHNGMDDYNKIIAKAIDTGDFSKVSRGGFEKFGIDDFRKFLQNNISKVNEVDPSTGRWSVNFKPIP